MIAALAIAFFAQAAEARAPQACDLTYSRRLEERIDGIEGELRIQSIGANCADAIILFEAFNVDGQRVLSRAGSSSNLFIDKEITPENAAERLAGLAEMSRGDPDQTAVHFASISTANPDTQTCLDVVTSEDLGRAQRANAPVLELYVAHETTDVFWFDPEAGLYVDLGTICF